MKPKKNETSYNDIEESRLKAKFVCNDCHGSLNSFHAPNRRYFVRCVNCEANRGFIRRTTANYRDLAAFGERAEIRNIRRKNAGSEFFGLDAAPKINEKEIMTELGFGG